MLISIINTGCGIWFWLESCLVQQAIVCLKGANIRTILDAVGRPWSYHSNPLKLDNLNTLCLGLRADTKLEHQNGVGWHHLVEDDPFKTDGRTDIPTVLIFFKYLYVFFAAEGVLAQLPWPNSDGAVITWHLNFKPLLSRYGIFPKLIVFSSGLTLWWQINFQAQNCFSMFYCKFHLYPHLVDSHCAMSWFQSASKCFVVILGLCLYGTEKVLLNSNNNRDCTVIWTLLELQCVIL